VSSAHLPQEHRSVSKKEYEEDLESDLRSDGLVLSRMATSLVVKSTDMDSPHSLYQLGFTLLQQLESRCFNTSQLLSARYPLSQLRSLNGLFFSIGDLRTAGYSAAQCSAAGYSLTELYNNGDGFDAQELTKGGLFSSDQLRVVGCDTQRFALMAIFEALGGLQWKRTANWGTCWPLGEWYGVSIDNRGQVVALKLSGNFLKGDNNDDLLIM
jgi:hypothetical protein